MVQLGDVIDGCNAKMHASETALATVLDVLSRPATLGASEPYPNPHSMVFKLAP